MAEQILSPTQLVTVITSEDPAARFQIVDSTSNDTAPRLLKSFPRQGDAVSWLLRNGYTWVSGNYPQQWKKI